MKTDEIMKSDVLDIIFENRNKAYGAYYLRKFYSNRLFKSLGLMLSGVIVLSAFTLMPKKKKSSNAEIIISTGYEMKELQKKNEEPEKPKEQQPVKKKVPTIVFNKPKIVKDDPDIKPFEKITDSVAIADKTEKGDSNAIAVVGEPVDKGDNNGKATEPVVEPKPDFNTPTYTAEVMPEFPGGMNALRRFLERNLSNPRDLEENETVSVKVRFVVGFDGKLKSFETIQDGGEEFNKEVIRVLKKMPEWVPGKTKGQNISVYYTIPVKFVAQN